MVWQVEIPPEQVLQAQKKGPEEEEFPGDEIDAILAAAIEERRKVRRKLKKN